MSPSLLRRPTPTTRARILSLRTAFPASNTSRRCHTSGIYQFFLITIIRFLLFLTSFFLFLGPRVWPPPAVSLAPQLPCQGTTRASSFKLQHIHIHTHIIRILTSAFAPRASPAGTFYLYRYLSHYHTYVRVCMLIFFSATALHTPLTSTKSSLRTSAT